MWVCAIFYDLMVVWSSGNYLFIYLFVIIIIIIIIINNYSTRARWI